MLKRHKRKVPMDEQPKHDDFQMVQVIGTGAYGTVHEAIDKQLKRRVAIKVVKCDPADPELRERVIPDMMREGRMLADLEDPLMPVYRVLHGEEPGEVWIVMRLVEGETLLRRIEGSQRNEDGSGSTVASPVRKERLRPGCDDLSGVLEIVRFFEQLARACGRAHAKDIVHGDIKPENIMIDAVNNSAPVLLDWGIARFVGARSSATSGAAQGANRYIYGSVHYMPPELLCGRTRDVNASGDVFALGVALYQTLTLCNPFSGSDLKALERRYSSGRDADSLRRRKPSVPRPIARVVAQALSLEATRRHSNGSKLASGLGKAVQSVEDWRVTKRRFRRGAVAAILIAFGFLVAQITTSVDLKVYFTAHQLFSAEDLKNSYDEHLNRGMIAAANAQRGDTADGSRDRYVPDSLTLLDSQLTIHSCASEPAQSYSETYASLRRHAEPEWWRCWGVDSIAAAFGNRRELRIGATSAFSFLLECKPYLVDPDKPVPYRVIGQRLSNQVPTYKTVLIVPKEVFLKEPSWREVLKALRTDRRLRRVVTTVQASTSGHALPHDLLTMDGWRCERTDDSREMIRVWGSLEAWGQPIGSEEPKNSEGDGEPVVIPLHRNTGSIAEGNQEDGKAGIDLVLLAGRPQVLQALDESSGTVAFLSNHDWDRLNDTKVRRARGGFAVNNGVDLDGLCDRYFAVEFPLSIPHGLVVVDRATWRLDNADNVQVVAALGGLATASPEGLERHVRIADLLSAWIPLDVPENEDWSNQQTLDLAPPLGDLLELNTVWAEEGDHPCELVRYGANPYTCVVEWRVLSVGAVRLDKQRDVFVYQSKGVAALDLDTPGAAGCDPEDLCLTLVRSAVADKRIRGLFRRLCSSASPADR